jgi:sugar phosphate isomerase/epimerase
MTQRIIGVAHLTLLGCSPPELARVASGAGFTHIGVRVLPATPTEDRYPLFPGSRMVTETARALSDHGVRVLDIEALRLDEHITADQWLPALEVGAHLGARVLNVIGADPDRTRLCDRFARLADDAEQYGIRAGLEPISYQHLRTLADAAAIVAEVGKGGIMLDTLHFQRAAHTVEEIAAIPPEMFAVVQVSDGPLRDRARVTQPVAVPMNQGLDGTPRQLESRLQRDLPGHGQFPLREILAALPSDLPVSAEVPDAAQVAGDGPEDWARRVHTATTIALSSPTIASSSRNASPA